MKSVATKHEQGNKMWLKRCFLEHLLNIFVNRVLSMEIQSDPQGFGRGRGIGTPVGQLSILL